MIDATNDEGAVEDEKWIVNVVYVFGLKWKRLRGKMKFCLGEHEGKPK